MKIQSSNNRWKNGVICLVSFLDYNIVHFLQIFADLSNKSKSIKATHLIHLNNLIMFSQKRVYFIGVWATVHDILRKETLEKVLTQ